MLTHGISGDHVQSVVVFNLSSLGGPQISMTSYICEERLGPESLKRLTLVDHLLTSVLHITTALSC